MEHEKDETVFDKIGGRGAVHLVVDQFYDKVINDKEVATFFEGADMQVQRGKMKAFLMMALGGPVQFTGKDLKSAHGNLVAIGLNDRHYDLIAKYLDQALQQNRISQDIRDVIAGVVEECRPFVLGK